MSDGPRAEAPSPVTSRRGIFGALAVLFALRLLTLLPPVIDDDEGFFAASANALTGPRSFFRRALDDKPPGTVWFEEAVRSITGPLHLAQWSRFAGILLLALTAWMIARIAKRFARPLDGSGRAGAYAAVAFLFGAGAFSPKLFALTNEQLLLVPITFAVWLAVDTDVAPGVVRWLFAGAALGVATWVKQTALVFFLPLLIALVLPRMDAREGVGARLGAAVLGLAAFFGFAVLGAWAAGFHDTWLWTIVYPREVLVAARRSLFSGWKDGAQNLLLFALLLLPLGLKAGEARAVVRERPRWILAGWALAALVAIAAGSGLFPHYFLLAVPPFSVLAGLALDRFPFRRWHWVWLWIAYAGCVVGATLPVTNLFWGNDLPYFTRAADRIRQLTRANDEVFLWGGSPVPLALSGRRNATRFVTSRFVVQPYANAETLRLFHDELLAAPPKLFVDLHARGDNMQNLPPESLPWLGALLAQRYDVWADPALPWARFYLRRDGNAPTQMAALCPSAPLEDARDAYPAALSELENVIARSRAGQRPADPSALDLELRADFSFELLHTSCRRGSLPNLTSELDRLRNGQRPPANELASRIEQLYAAHHLATPLPLATHLWWIELAIVHMQPVIRPRPR